MRGRLVASLTCSPPGCILSSFDGFISQVRISDQRVILRVYRCQVHLKFFLFENITKVMKFVNLAFFW